MKKLLSLIFTFILIIQPSFGFGIYKKIDFEKDSEPRASKILYEHMLKFENKTPEELKDFANIYPESVKAVEIDLNDDGKKEVVGLILSTYCMGTAGHSLFILQLENNEYKDITYIVNFSLCKSFYILKHKTNGYRDIKLYGSISYNFKTFIVKYKNGLYKNDIQTRGLERALRQ